MATGIDWVDVLARDAPEDLARRRVQRDEGLVAEALFAVPIVRVAKVKASVDKSKKCLQGYALGRLRTVSHRRPPDDRAVGSLARDDIKGRVAAVRLLEEIDLLGIGCRDREVDDGRRERRRLDTPTLGSIGVLQRQPLTGRVPVVTLKGDEALSPVKCGYAVGVAAHATRRREQGAAHCDKREGGDDDDEPI